MGRITANVVVSNLFDESCAIQCHPMVDTGASHLVLPQAWKPQLGTLKRLATVRVETADGTHLDGEICGPVQLQVDCFRPVITEVMFIGMAASAGEYEPVLGSIILEAIPAVVDMQEDRLKAGKILPLKTSREAGET